MISQIRVSPQRLPIKKRYISQFYDNSQAALTAQATQAIQAVHAAQVAHLAPSPPTTLAVQTSPIKPIVEQIQEPVGKAAEPTPALPLVSLTQIPQQQLAQRKQARSTVSLSRLQVTKRTQQRRSPKHRNHSCYHTFNANLPQVEPLDLSKNHSCRDCTSNYKATDKLKAHKRRDDIKKSGRYTCEKCAKPFVQQSSLITHRRIHTGEKPYHCKVCDNSYGDLSTFTKHTRTHTGEKPYKCEYCDQRFSQSGNCLRHKRSVHAFVFTWI